LLFLGQFDHDSRAQLICRDILKSGWDLDIITVEGGSLTDFQGAPIHRIPQPVIPFRQRRFIEFNIKAATLARSLKADIYHAIDLDTLWAAVSAAKKTRAKVLYESRELYTEQLALLHRNHIKLFWKILESRYIRKADAIVTINESIADELQKRYTINKPTIVMNVADTQKIAAKIDLKNKYDLSGKFVLLYQGVLRPGQGIFRALKALSQIPEAGLVFVGDGPLRNEIETQVEKLDISSRVRLTGRVAPEELSGYTAGADAGLLLMEAEAMNNYLALPQKLFQYIEVGVPPVVTDLPELKKIVMQDNLGLTLNYLSDANDVLSLKRFLREDLPRAKAACESIRGKYNWSIEGKKLLEIYRSLI